ncbi:MAG: hypothetical protein QF681_16970 [Vicinamibacterales bacterium]|jgi:hypothetical protein|nr:hypothetical protein [Vicinamibacterales bacterium]|tara:strand:+ start:657 stop:818 length:162 start_codon:yes stop_codon:yes gene_type:complete
MLTRYILAVLSVVFLVAAWIRITRDGPAHPQTRTWLLIGAIFGIVSGWLFYQG